MNLKRCVVKKIKPILLVVAMVALLTGCYINDYQDIDTVRIESFSPSYGLPVINSTISIDDLLGAMGSNDFVEVRNDSIFLKLSQEMEFEVDLNSFKVPDKSFSGTMPVLPTSESYEYYYPDYTTLENDSKIKRIELKGGELTVGFERDFLDDGASIRLVLHSLTNDQNPDSIEFAPNWDNDPYFSSTSIDLSGAVLDLSMEDPNSPGDMLYNSFSYALEVYSNGVASGNLTTHISFSSIEFERFTGSINYEMEIPAQEIDLEAFSSVVDGKLYIQNPSLALGIGTSFGVPASAEISQIKFTNNVSEMVLANEGESDENDFLLGEGEKNYLPYATENEPWVSKQYVLDGDNSNIEEILPFAPSNVSLEGVFRLGDTNEMPDDPYSFFVNDTSTFKLNLDIEVPLAGSIEGLTYSYDLYDMSFPSLDSLFATDPDSDINIDASMEDYSVELMMKTINEIPMTFGLQVVFSDRGTPLDSLFSDAAVKNIIQSPSVDSQGNLGSATETEVSIKLSKEKYSKIAGANKMQLKFYIDAGTEQTPVVFKASQELTVQMAVRLDLKVGPGEQ